MKKYLIIIGFILFGSYTFLNALPKRDASVNDLLDFTQAAASNNLKKMKSILAQTNLDIDEQQSNGLNALHLAADRDNLDIVKFLLDNKANPNIKDNDGVTALHGAVFIGNLEMVKVLVEHEADPNIKTNKGTTALDIAKNMKSNDIVDYLKNVSTKK